MYFLKKEFELTPDRVTFLNEIKGHKERKLHKEMFRKTKEQTGPRTSAEIMVLETTLDYLWNIKNNGPLLQGT